MNNGNVRKNRSPCAMPMLLIPRLDDTLDELSSKIYLKRGYHQIKMREGSNGKLFLRINRIV